MKKTVLIALTLIILISFTASFSYGRDDYIKAGGLIHLNSDVSSGEYSPEKLVGMAKEAGAGAVFLTENLMPRWQYGIFPLRNIIKKTVEKSGLLRYGPERYAERINKINEKLPQMTVLMAAEVAPFYFWSGTPFKKEGLTLNDWDLQFIITGLDPSDYRGIPTVSNGKFSYYGFGSILKLWPLVLLLVGVKCLRRKTSKVCLPDFLCWILIITGAVFTINNYPFKEMKYDQYHGRQGVFPYQDVIDYVNEKGGMVFWSNPEAFVSKKIGPVMYVSPTADKYMLESKGYTGFSSFYEGYRSIGSAGGVWDTVLKEYCAGERDSPVWTMGEMAYHSREASGGKEIDEVQTVFLVPSNTQKDILDAMRRGRMYAVRKKKGYPLELDSFTVERSDGKRAMMGEEINAAGPVTINFSVSWRGETSEKITVKLIRSGEVIKEFPIEKGAEYRIEDDLYTGGDKIYYRLDVRGKYPSMLFSNPIFVNFTEEGST